MTSYFVWDIRDVTLSGIFLSSLDISCRIVMTSYFVWDIGDVTRSNWTEMADLKLDIQVDVSPSLNLYSENINVFLFIYLLRPNIGILVRCFCWTANDHSLKVKDII